MNHSDRFMLMCILTDGGGALILTSAERAKDFGRPVYIVGTGESVETPMVSQMEDFTTSRAFRFPVGKPSSPPALGTPMSIT